MKDAHSFAFSIFFNCRFPGREKKQENLLIDSISSDFCRLTFQSAAIHKIMKQRQQQDDDDDDDDGIPVAGNSCRGSGNGCVLQIKHSASPPLFSLSAGCDAVQSWPIIIVFLWAK